MNSYRIPGPLGGLMNGKIDEGTLCRVTNPRPGPFGIKYDNSEQSSTFMEFYKMNNPAPVLNLKAVDELSLSEQGLALLKDIEQLFLKPYDDQTGKEISAWTAGATIGYGHLIKSNEWSTYQNGMTLAAANNLFAQDLSPFVKAVKSNIKVKLQQHQFDALVMFAFNIGAGIDGFAGSSVVKLVNDPNAQTIYQDIEAAWKAWNKSQGKVMKGLQNRRECEWSVYSKGIYKKW